MAWYYAGPEAKPIGPVTLEELKALRVRGTIAAETYVIEEKGQGMAGLAWKRYRENFPDAASLPPLPPVPGLPPVQQVPYVPPPVPPVTPPPVMQAHPLFPSAAPSGTPAKTLPLLNQMTKEYGQQPYPFAGGARPDPYYHARPTNAWCAWGFGLGLAAFFFSFACGIGLLPALVSVPLCIIGLTQLAKHREQAGHWFAIWGLVLSSLALVISVVIVLYLAYPIMKAHGLTVTEETTNDSE
jgi:hypothetical protein